MSDMAENKTKPEKTRVAQFLKKKTTGEQLADCQALVKLFKDLTGKKATMWGPSIVGFGSYHYVYPSGHEGDAPLVGFAPRGKEIVLYLSHYDARTKALLAKLGKHRAGVGCVYVKKLADVNPAVLAQLARASMAELKSRYLD